MMILGTDKVGINFFVKMQKWMVMLFILGGVYFSYKILIFLIFFINSVVKSLKKNAQHNYVSITVFDIKGIPKGEISNIDFFLGQMIILMSY